MTHDADVRPMLRRVLAMDAPGALIMDELGLDYGCARADVAVIGDEIHGYEIKAAADTLSRLRSQVHFYGWVCDRVTLVAAPCHLDAARERVPAWWGLWSIRPWGFDLVRVASANPEVALHKQAALLWRAEAAELLERVTGAPTRRRMNKGEIQRALVARMAADDLRRAVRDGLRARKAWRYRSGSARRGAA